MVVFLAEFETHFGRGDGFLLLNFEVVLEEELELEGELELCCVEVVGELRVGRADGEVEVGHSQTDFLGALWVEVGVGVQTDGVVLDRLDCLCVCALEEVRVRIRDVKLFCHANLLILL